MPRMRHWKQRWDANADFVFTRRMRVGSTGAPWVPAGSDVDKVVHARLLKKWWAAGLIAIKGWTPALARTLARAKQEQRRAVPVAPPAPPRTEAPLGAGEGSGGVRRTSRRNSSERNGD